MQALRRVNVPRAAAHRSLVVMAVTNNKDNAVNKTDFSKMLADKLGKSQAEAKKSLDETLSLIQESVSEGKKVTFVGYASRL